MAVNGKPAPTKDDETVERIYYEHISCIYPTIIICVVLFFIIVAAAVITETLLILLLSLLLILPIYLKNRRRNKFLITNKRFIRALLNPKEGAIDVPLDQIVSVKSISRSSDAKGSVHVYTTPAYGDQILVDNETEVGVIACHKVTGHADFAEVLSDAALRAKHGY